MTVERHWLGGIAAEQPRPDEVLCPDCRDEDATVPPCPRCHGRGFVAPQEER